MIAVGEHCWGSAPPYLVRASCPFGGGVAGSYQELCGVLSGGVLVLGALLGRASSAEDDTLAYRFAGRYRELFLAAMGNSRCEAIRSSLPAVPKRCLPVLERGVALLLDLIDDARSQGLVAPSPPAGGGPDWP